MGGEEALGKGASVLAIKRIVSQVLSSHPGLKSVVGQLFWVREKPFTGPARV